jgi:hypothetical protein
MSQNKKQQKNNKKIIKKKRKKGMSGLFIRGDPYLPQQFFYLAGKDKNGKYYFLIKAIKDDLTSNAVFCALQAKYINDSDLITVSFTPNTEKTEKTTYTMKGFTENSVTGTFEVRDGVIDLIPNSKVVNNINISSLGNYLYPGIYITVQDINGKDVLWKIQNNENGRKPSQGYIYDNLQLMLLQKNDKNNTFAVWDGQDCFTSSVPTEILSLFEDWVAGKQINCQQAGHVTQVNKGCPFNSVKSCFYGYLYNTCENCNDCLGICDENQPCRLTYDKKAVDGQPFMACGEHKENKVKDFWEQYKIYIIVAIVIFIILVILIGVAIGLSVKKAKATPA